MIGFTRNFEPLKILADEQIDAIHSGTLDVLERTGLVIEHERGLRLLEASGCHVDGERVRFPRDMVEECLRLAPASFTMTARDPEKSIVLGENNFIVTTFPGMQTVDLTTWEPRTATRQEYYEGVTVLDALDNLHYTGNYVPYFGFEGVSPAMCIPEGFAARARNCSKVLKTATSNDSEVFNIEIARAVGSDVMVTVNPSPPMTYYTSAVEAIYRGIEADCPLGIASGAVMGGTGPATLAGSSLVDSAALIGGVVMAQLIKPGAKVLVFDFIFPLNMRSGIPAFGAIECALSNAAFGQYFGRLGIPTGANNVGPVNSKRIDFQCGYEKAMLGTLAAVCGINNVYLTGSIFGELTFHPVQAILDDDISGMIGRFLAGMRVDEDTLATELIDQVGPIPGFYLNKAHTRKWWRRERFQPKTADGLSLPEWMLGGKKGAIDYAQERMEDILATHKPIPLSPTQEEEVERILEEARRYYRQKGLL